MLEYSPARWLTSLAIAALWSTPSIAFDLPVTAQPVSLAGLAVGEKKALHVGLQIPATVETLVFTGAPSTPGKTGSEREVGWNLNASIPTGRLLKDGSQAGLSQAFSKVTLFGSGAYPADVGAVVVPKLVQFQYWLVRNRSSRIVVRDYAHARATVRLTVLDRNGLQLWSKDTQTPDMPGFLHKAVSVSALTQAVGQAAAQAVGLALQAGIEEMVSAPAVASLWNDGTRHQPAAATCSSPTANIAVLDLVGSGGTTDELQALTNRLCSELFKTGCFTVLERSEMDNILREQAFQQSGCTSTECMVEVGRLLSVRYMVGGNVARMGELYTLDLRMIDVQSGTIVGVATQDVSGGIEKVVTEGLGLCVATLVSARK